VKKRQSGQGYREKYHMPSFPGFGKDERSYFIEIKWEFCHKFFWFYVDKDGEI